MSGGDGPASEDIASDKPSQGPPAWRGPAAREPERDGPGGDAHKAWLPLRTLRRSTGHGLHSGLVREGSPTALKASGVRPSVWVTSGTVLTTLLIRSPFGSSATSVMKVVAMA